MAPAQGHRQTLRLSALLLALPLAGGLLLAPGASAHEAVEKGKPLVAKTKASIAQSFDDAAPSAEHTHEHEAIDALIAKIRTMTPAARLKLQQKSLGITGGKAQRLVDKVVGPASEFGAWTTAPFPAPTYAIHTMLLPTGRVLVMSMGQKHGAGRPGSYIGQDVNNDGAAALWDPTRGTGASAFKEIDPPLIALDDPQKRKGYNKLRTAPVYCSGQVQLADGRVLIAGGNLEGGNGGFGLKMLWLFDPFTETWIRQADLKVARWYPTLTRLPSGQVVILAGRDAAGKNRPEVELYPAAGQAIPGIDTAEPATGASTEVKTSRNNPSFYPHAYVMKSGNLAIVGPTLADSGVLNPITWKWKNSTGFRQGPNGYGSSFLEPGTTDGPDRVFAFGGLSLLGQLQPLVSSTRPEIDSRWTDQSGLKLSRRNSPAVILPDGTVMAIGGGNKDLRTVDPTNAWPTRRQPELWDPATRKWKLGPAQRLPRGYHSTAVLLPDGRVLSAGDDLQSTLFDNDLDDAYDTTFELYSPPYLFKGPRPVITSTPATANYGRTFDLTIEGDATEITRVTAVAPGSNTHALDMNQRHLDLQVINREGNTVTVMAPPTPAAAPPGDYMVFALSAEGVPSVGKLVQVLPLGSPAHPANDSAPDWGDNPTPPGTDPPVDPNPPVTTPTTPPVVTPPVKAPRPWWWPIFLPWNG